MNAPQIVMIVLFVVGFFGAARDHGKPKKGNENFFFSITCQAVLFGLLWWGGFWK